MQLEQIVEMVFGVVGGLGIFLLGMRFMSEGMQAVAGDKLRRMINTITNNRLLACGVGTIVTAIIQSSSVTTVMVVGMVNAGLMELTQAIGVIFGANIGTTMTGWILSVDVAKYGLPLLGVSAFIYLFSKRDSLRFTAGAFLGLGMVFFGLELMKAGFVPLRQLPEFKEWFMQLEPAGYLGVMKCVLVGATLTAVVQSSSATLGITMALAETGMITYPTAAALVLGENIGTTITALLSSIGTNRNAKRAAYAHTIFNVLGVLWITAIFFYYIKGVQWVTGIDPTVTEYGDAGTSYPNTRPLIAMTHSGFNVVNTLIFLPLIPYLARLLYKILPERPLLEKPHLTYLDMRMLETPAIGMEQSEKEIAKMGRTVYEMMEPLRELLAEGQRDRLREESIFKRERDLDLVQMEVTRFLSNIMGGNIPHDLINQGRRQVRMADEYESISDYITTILKLNLKLHDAQESVTEAGRAELLQLHDAVADYVRNVNEAVQREDGRILKEAQAQGQVITRLMKDSRTKHLRRVEAGDASPIKSLIFTDMLNSYRRIKDHALNIAEALAGEK